MENNTEYTLPLDYNTGNITAETAIPLFNILANSMKLNYPEGNDELKSICETAMTYLADNNLTETSLYNQLKIKIENFDILRDAKELKEMKEDNFHHIKGLLSNHAAWITIKLGPDKIISM